MKKLITMMLVLLIVGGAVFGATGDVHGAASYLTLNSTVGSRYGLKLLETALVADTVPNFTGATVLEAIAFGEADAENVTAYTKPKTVYISMMSNKNVGYDVNVLSASPLAAVGETTKIGYTVTPGNTTLSPVTVLKTAVSGVVINLATFSAASGTRVSSSSFTVQMTTEDWEAAAESDSYTTSWTINLVSK